MLKPPVLFGALFRFSEVFNELVVYFTIYNERSFIALTFVVRMIPKEEAPYCLLELFFSLDKKLARSSV